MQTISNLIAEYLEQCKYELKSHSSFPKALTFGFLNPNKSAKFSNC